MESFPRALREACGQRLFSKVVKSPKHDKGDRKIKEEDAGKSVAECSVMPKRNEVLEIGGEAAYDQSGHHETCATKGQCGCGVGQGEGHCIHYEGFGEVVSQPGFK